MDQDGLEPGPKLTGRSAFELGEPAPRVQDRVLDDVGRRRLARVTRPSAPADDQPEVIAARLQRVPARRRVTDHRRYEIRVEGLRVQFDVRSR